MKKLLLLLLLVLFSCSKEDNSALIESYTTQINSLQTQLAESQSEIRRLLNEVNAIPGLESIISSLQSELTAQVDNNSDLQDTIYTLNSQIDANNDLIASLQEQIEANKPFDVNSMDIVKYPLYNKDTLSGKKVDTKQINFNFFTNKGMDLREIDFESNLDFLASESFIVYWDKRYAHTNYAIDILRWAEFAAIKAIEMGMPKPKKFDTHRMNIFITRDDEFGDDIFPGTQCQCSHTTWGDGNDSGTLGRKYLTFPWYRNFIESETKLRNYPYMNVLHEVFHSFQRGNSSWIAESTAEYFEGTFLAEIRPGTRRFIPDFLMSTHFKLWSGYDNNGNGTNDADDILHIYGKQLLWYYLDWNGHIDKNFIGRLNSDTSGISKNEYIIQNISNFRDLYFDFTMKSTVVDFPKWNDHINYLLNNVNPSGRFEGYKRHELVLKSNNNQITKLYDEYNYNGEFISPSVNIEPWGFISYKIQSESDNNYKIEIETEHTKYRLGVIVKRNNEYQYYEINSGDIINFINNDMVYVVIVDIPDSNYTNVDNADPFKIKFSLQE